MGLLEDLETTEPKRSGPKCIIQQIRGTAGDTEAWHLLIVCRANVPLSQRMQVLQRNGYGYISSQVVSRHGSNNCVGCRNWHHDEDTAEES